MLVWFIFRDEPGEPWQSGLLDRRGRAKPSLARFAADVRAGRARPPRQADPASLVHAFRMPGARAPLAPRPRARGSASVQPGGVREERRRRHDRDAHGLATAGCR